VDVFLQKRRGGKAAERVLKRFLQTLGREPRKFVTDKLRSYNVAHEVLIPEVIHDTTQCANNRAELSHKPTQARERGVGKFKSIEQAQRSRVHMLPFKVGSIEDGVRCQLRTLGLQTAFFCVLGKGSSVVERQFTRFSGPSSLTCQHHKTA